MLKKPWYKIKETDGVINFIDAKTQSPLGEDEIGRILRQVNEAEGKEVPKVKFAIGEVVKILDGPFLNLTGEIDEIDAEKGTIKKFPFLFSVDLPQSSLNSGKSKKRTKNKLNNKQNVKESSRPNKTSTPAGL